MAWTTTGLLYMVRFPRGWCSVLQRLQSLFEMENFDLQIERTRPHHEPTINITNEIFLAKRARMKVVDNLIRT